MSILVKRINRQVQVVRVGKQGKPGPQGPEGPKGDPATNLVQSVNGKQGAVVLNATDVGADPTGSASQALQDAKDYTDTEVSTLDSSLATVAKTGSYNDLTNKPTIPSIAGLATETQVQDVQDNLDAHEADMANPHSVTKAQVGLANVDNTSDADKPVSTATQSALDGKVGKVTTVNTLYGVNGSGNQTSYLISQSSDTSSIAQRSSGGTLAVGTPTSNTHATTKAYVDAADALKLNISDNRVELRGTGFPQGVVSAPVGTTYVDTAATNGAIEWKKATGSSSTGWVVSAGDTGWRDITSLFSATIEVVSGFDYGVWIRRTNQSIELSIKAQSKVASWNGQVTNLPAGFKFDSSSVGKPAVVGEALQIGGSGRGQIQVNHLVTLVSSPGIGIGTRFFFTALGLANQSELWPTTLPGSSV